MEFSTGISTNFDRTFSFDAVENYNQFLKENTSFKFDDTVTTALRTNEGINLASLTDRHRDYLMARAQKYIHQGLLAQEGENIILTKKGLFVSDSIMADFMYV